LTVLDDGKHCWLGVDEDEDDKPIRVMRNSA